MSLFRTSIIIIALGLVASCGYRPLYGKYSSKPQAGAKLENVYVATISDRRGQLVRNELQTLINPKGQRATRDYTLTIKLVENKSQQLQRTDESATRADLYLRARFSLKSHLENKIIFSGNSMAISSYDLADAEYSQVATAKSALKRAAINLAQDIKSRLSTYFLNPPKNTSE